MSKQVQDAYLGATTRTPVGKAPRGVFRHTRPDDMLAHVIRAVLAQAPGVDPGRIEDVIIGCAMPEAEQGMNVARIGLLLAGLPPPDTTTDLGSLRLSLPVFAAPFGNDGWIHPDGHLAVARAVHRIGTTTVAPHGSGHTLEAIATAAQGSQGMFQAGLDGADDVVLAMVERAAAAGYRYILFTHLPVRAWRERVYEHRLDLGSYSRANIDDSEPIAPAGSESAAEGRRWGWERFAALARRCPIPWFFKGIQHPDDAKRVLDLGAAGLYVSNYGGRNLDGVPPSIDRLAAIADEADGMVPIAFDSGIRRGTDVVKALALGASAVAVGRLGAFALGDRMELVLIGAGGEAAVYRLFELLREEIVAVMAELGVRSVTELGRHHLAEMRGFTFPPLTDRNREV